MSLWRSKQAQPISSASSQSDYYKMRLAACLLVLTTTPFLGGAVAHSRPSADHGGPSYVNLTGNGPTVLPNNNVPSPVVKIGNMIVRIPGRLLAHYPRAPEVLAWSEKHLRQGLFEDVKKGISGLCAAVVLTNTIKPIYTPELHQINITLVSGDEDIVSAPLTAPEMIVQSPKFYTERNTTIFITGWGFDANNNFLPFLRLSEAYKCQPRYNFLIIDIGKFIDTVFTWASFDTEQMGVFVGNALVKIHESVATENFHVIGHGIGAHVAGAAARQFEKLTGEKLERITGLDPSAFCSITLPGEGLRGLRRGDARFVDVIHTNSGGFGISNSIGDVDFYPNGVVPLQPGCYSMTCAHLRAIDYFAETVFPGNGNHFRSAECSSLKGIMTNECGGNQIQMGFLASSAAKGDYFLITNERYPYGKNTSPTSTTQCAREAHLKID